MFNSEFSWLSVGYFSVISTGVTNWWRCLSCTLTDTAAGHDRERASLLQEDHLY